MIPDLLFFSRLNGATAFVSHFRALRPDPLRHRETALLGASAGFASSHPFGPFLGACWAPESLLEDTPETRELRTFGLSGREKEGRHGLLAWPFRLLKTSETPRVVFRASTSNRMEISDGSTAWEVHQRLQEKLLRKRLS